MKLCLKLFVFIIFTSNIVKSKTIKRCVKNILGECVRPLVPARVKTKPIDNVVNDFANAEGCDKSGECMETSRKHALRQGYLDDGNSTNVNHFEDVNWDVFCKFQPNGYDCSNKGHKHVYYYDLKLQGCKEAKVGSLCSYNFNQYQTLKECYTVCRDDGEHSITNSRLVMQVACRLQADFGDCDGYFPSFYYDMTQRHCVGFSYSGCGGNDNRFPTAAICSAHCAPVVDYNGNAI